MVEWDALEKRYTGNGIEGSNPSASANIKFTCFSQVRPSPVLWVGPLFFILNLG